MNAKQIQEMPIEELHRRLSGHGYAADEIKVLFSSEQEVRDFYLSLQKTAKLTNGAEPDDPTSAGQLNATEEAEAASLVKAKAAAVKRKQEAKAALKKQVLAAEAKLNQAESAKAQAHLPPAERVSPEEVKSAMTDIRKLLNKSYDEDE